MPKYWMEAAANIWATGSGTIRDLGLEYHIVFNKGAVMVLPPGTNKATGLKAALADLDLSTRSVIGIEDAENDFAFPEACGCSADIGNAKPALKNMVGVVLEGRWARGVMELIEQVISKDAGIIPAGRHGIRVGIDRNGDEVQIVPYRPGSFTTLHSARARSGLLAVVFGQKEGPLFSARSPTVILTT
jgi:hypothetical protein